MPSASSSIDDDALVRSFDKLSLCFNRDGVYLTVAPRLVTKLPIPSGGRADVAVRCSSAGAFTWQSKQKWNRRRTRRTLLKTLPFVGTVMTVQVTDATDDGITSTDDGYTVFGGTGSFSVNRPWWVVSDHEKSHSFLP